MGQKDQRQLVNMFAIRGVWYQPAIAHLVGSVNAGIFMSQLLYWHGKGTGKGGWIYKTVEEMKRETALSRSNQETAIKVLENTGLIEVRLAGIPRKRHFRIQMTSVTIQLHRMLESDEFEWLKSSGSYAGFQRTNTESSKEHSDNKTETLEQFKKMRASLNRKFGMDSRSRRGPSDET